MKGETCWRLFRFLAIDHKAAQEWLNHMAAQVWELERIYCGLFAKFRRTERADLTYFLDWTDSKEPGDYIQLCFDAGWALIQTAGYLNVYAARPGTHPLPIQTDPELEYQRFRKKAVRNAALLLAILLLGTAALLCLGLLDTTPSRLLLDLLTSYNTLLFLVFTAPLALTGLAVYLFLVVRWSLHCRRALQNGNPPPQASLARARRRGLLRLLGRAYIGLCFLSFLLDVLIGQLASPLFALILFLGNALFLPGMKKDDPAQYQQSKGILLSCYLPLLVCALLSIPLRAVFPGPGIPAPMAGAEDIRDLSHHRSLLGSHTQWREYTGSADSFYYRWDVDVYTWASPAVMDFLSPFPDQEAQPVEGHPGVWLLHDGHYLIRQGTTQTEVVGITRQPIAYTIDDRALHME